MVLENKKRKMVGRKQNLRLLALHLLLLLGYALDCSTLYVIVSIKSDNRLQKL